MTPTYYAQPLSNMTREEIQSALKAGTLEEYLVTYDRGVCKIVCPVGYELTNIDADGIDCLIGDSRQRDEDEADVPASQTTNPPPTDGNGMPAAEGKREEEKLEIINLTPHALNLRAADGSIQVIPPSGQVARVAETRVALPPVAGLSVSRATYGAVEGLPDPTEGKIFVVSGMVLAAVPHRADVFAPGPAIRDSEGKIIGADGLSATPAYK